MIFLVEFGITKHLLIFSTHKFEFRPKLQDMKFISKLQTLCDLEFRRITSEILGVKGFKPLSRILEHLYSWITVKSPTVQLANANSPTYKIE